MHQPILSSQVQSIVQPKAKPRARSAEASARSLAILEPSVTTRPCIGATLQRRFPHLVQHVSPSLRQVQSDDEVFTNSSSSSRPPPPLSSHPVDDPERALPPEAETINNNEVSGDLDDLERVNAESAVSRAVPAALAASLPLAAPADVVTRAAADAPAPRKKRSRPFNIPRS